MITRPPQTSRFLELLLVGAWTPVLIPLSFWARAHFDVDDAELAIGFLAFHAAHVLNDPHFAVTYLLFYGNAHGRMFDTGRYFVAGVLVPVMLVSFAGYALFARSAQTLGWMVQLMFLLVGWHYTKQGFGVLTVLSARREIRFGTFERKAILAHCYAAWAFAWATPPLPAGQYAERGVLYWAIERPLWFAWIAGLALFISTLVLVATLARKWSREGSLPHGPLLAFLATVWLWTIGSATDPLVRYVIPALHALQYLFFVGLLRRNEARAEEGPPRFRRPVGIRLVALTFGALGLGWVLFRGGPALLDATLIDARNALGPTPFAAAFYIVVNLHHFAMDAVIWRRDHPPTRFLLGPA